MRIDILTLFPELFSPLFGSIPAKAQKEGRVEIELHDLRDWGRGRHRQVDDVPFGGGPGMVLQPGPLAAALAAIAESDPRPCTRIYLSPQGRPLDQALAEELSRMPRLVLVCGHYEGIDERIRQSRIDMEVSLGDFVLSGGELPAMVLADAVIRLIPGVLDAESVRRESFTLPLLDHPHYTRPADFEGATVPEVLQSGHHARIERWRHEQALLRTASRRPDLLRGRPLPVEDRERLAQAAREGLEIPPDLLLGPTA